jgi:hypothetical protein
LFSISLLIKNYSNFCKSFFSAFELKSIRKIENKPNKLV